MNTGGSDVAVLAQLSIAFLVGVAAWFISNLSGVVDPWPVVIGVTAGLLCLGVAIIIVDEDTI